MMGTNVFLNRKRRNPAKNSSSISLGGGGGGEHIISLSLSLSSAIRLCPTYGGAYNYIYIYIMNWTWTPNIYNMIWTYHKINKKQYRVYIYIPVYIYINIEHPVSNYQKQQTKTLHEAYYMHIHIHNVCWNLKHRIVFHRLVTQYKTISLTQIKCRGISVAMSVNPRRSEAQRECLHMRTEGPPAMVVKLELGISY